MTSRELDKKLTEKKNAIWNDIELLTALKVHCEEPYCRAIDNAIQALRDKANMIIIRYEWEKMEGGSEWVILVMTKKII